MLFAIFDKPKRRLEEERGLERSFTKEIESLKLGAGEVFHGEGILAVTKALLQPKYIEHEIGSILC